MTLALLALMTLCQPKTLVPAAEPTVFARARQVQINAAPIQLATFYPVCRDGRGAWDRRACRHVRRTDPARLLLV